MVAVLSYLGIGGGDRPEELPHLLRQEARAPSLQRDLHAIGDHQVAPHLDGPRWPGCRSRFGLRGRPGEEVADAIERDTLLRPTADGDELLQVVRRVAGCSRLALSPGQEADLDVVADRAAGEAGGGGELVESKGTRLW